MQQAYKFVNDFSAGDKPANPCTPVQFRARPPKLFKPLHLRLISRSCRHCSGSSKCYPTQALQLSFEGSGPILRRWHSDQKLLAKPISLRLRPPDSTLGRIQNVSLRKGMVISRSFHNGVDNLTGLGRCNRAGIAQCARHYHACIHHDAISGDRLPEMPGAAFQNRHEVLLHLSSMAEQNLPSMRA
ncbi:hypothetical protein [Rhizobium sp. Leaf262]|uniref:hypothetical protein n=1 Tax=Rhizobium sp. Leaf262 TaxID=1736312 RepID=UPI0012E75CDE|nr:hypothetical protein [Rhizobium sp. Leaf262]